MTFFWCLVILITILLIYYSVSSGLKISVLFISSIIFISVLSLSVAIFALLFTLLNFYLGILLGKNHKSKRIKERLFWVCIILNICILAFFKYVNPFLEGFNSSLFSDGIYSNAPYNSIMIPMGISYYTFQSLGYLIRIDRGSEKAERSFSSFATYLLFFPKFLSGPVERSNLFLPQLKKPIGFHRSNIELGSRLFLWGLFKKVAIADNLYSAVSNVYRDIHSFNGTSLLIVLIVQSIYIYCDFSGYTDMALGIAKCFGLNLMDNFNRPFLARNVSEFWRRWHISLSSWCNDFIYNPFIVKYRRFGNKAVIFAIFLTFFIVGIWHGANFTFVILGLLQGVAIVYEFRTKRYRLKIASRFSKSTSNTLSRIIVFFFMAFSMVFFFSNSVSDAFYLITHLFQGIHFDRSEFSFIENKPKFSLAIFFFIVILIIQIFNEKGKNLQSKFLNLPIFTRWAGYIICIALIFLMYSGVVNVFYYMRF
ncbi:MBOAT family protein [Hanamia caeni]|uniref:MBOAT family protein n=1 Tax=Hanamia caeni TaxID=2294116 RepID=A0A3M9NI91_9BACT|nr:MBOAT family protein [Hanamia caeni]